ncbi:putative pre-mRNA-splicing factor ATP-dependent RNA helicase DHX16 [Yarrowia sp. E02]|nr:putative pre-mRNA-splicing factor ATP-dependent RNA helicase DHX16 [Yarrowia sp. E02]
MKREELQKLYNALDKKGGRAIIVATQMAQDYTSLPPGIKYVIDSGLQMSPEGKQIWATKLDCEIRANRVSASGAKVYRMFSEETFESLLDMPPAQVSVDKLDCVVFYWLSLGVQNILTLDTPTKYPQRLVASALTSLHNVGLISKDGQLTKVAQSVSALSICFPFIPARYISAIAHSFGEPGQSAILSIIAMELAGGLNEALYTPKQYAKHEEAQNIHALFEVEEGPYITLLNIYESSCTPKLKPTRWFAEHFINYQMVSTAHNIRRELSSVIGGIRTTNADNSEQLDSCQEILKRYVEE